MKVTQDPSRFRASHIQTRENINYRIDLEEYFANSVGSYVERLINFTKYVPRQDITTFISRYEIFKKILNVQGSIVEGGVAFGRGLMTWAHLSSIFEPVNHQRQIIGFDTFEGYPNVSDDDKKGEYEELESGGFATHAYNDLLRCIELYDANRFLGHIPKVFPIRGDVRMTIPEYVKANPYLVVSLLYLDFNLAEPTRVALEHLVPRMPKGAIIAFDSLNSPNVPGETIPVLEFLGMRNLRVERFSFDTLVSFAVLE